MVRTALRPALRSVAAAALVLCSACGGSPTSPNPPPPPPPANAAPIIDSITIERTRLEAGEETAVTAAVRDTETPVNQLRYEWSASGGTFQGQAASVTWRAPQGGATPQDYALTLTVIEQYGSANAQGVRPEHRVVATSSPIRVHDSPREVGELALRFLGDFANSSVPANQAVREFSDSCRGKFDELIDIQDNRRDFDIVSSSLQLRSVSVAGNRATASMRVACAFTSRIKQCPPDRPGCPVGSLESVAGDCLLTAVYEQNRWLLCQSNFDGDLVSSMRAFFGAR